VNSIAGSGRNYNFFGVRDGVDRRQINIQMCLNERRRQMRQPLVQRHILVLRAFEHLKKYEILGSRILDVMRKRLLYVANVASLEIHGTGVAASCENCHSSAFWCQCQFAQSSGMDDDMRRRDRIRGLENLRIDDAYFSCLCPMRRLAANSAHIVLERVLGAVGECLDRQSAEALTNPAACRPADAGTDRGTS
jgi:hypothetical protein